MSEKQFNEILARIRTGATTNADADKLREMMHKAWAENAKRRGNEGVQHD